ncbi:MAG TPA: hypothetical protein VKR53_09885 [Puia sp.]|nr:hypothetical protein [Puia sp.]
MAKFCAWCGSLINETDKFCGSCGKEIIKTSPRLKEERNNQRKEFSKKKYLKNETMFLLITVGALLIFIVFGAISEHKWKSTGDLLRPNQTYADTSKNLDGYKSIPDSVQISGDSTKMSVDSIVTEPTSSTDTFTTNNNYSNQPQNNSNLIINAFNITEDFNKYNLSINEKQSLCKWCNTFPVMGCSIRTDAEINSRFSSFRLENVLIDYMNYMKEKKPLFTADELNRIMNYFDLDSLTRPDIYSSILKRAEKNWFSENYGLRRMLFGSSNKKDWEILINRYADCQSFCSLKCQSEYYQKYGTTN